MSEPVQQALIHGEAAVHDPAESAPQVAPDLKDSSVREFIGKLVKARKDLGFYPNGNPAVRTAMQKCEEVQSETVADYGAVSLVISRDQFYVGGRPLFRSESPERRFAAELFVLGVRRMSFTGEAGAAEFEEFLGLLREAQGDPALFMAALSGSSAQRMKGIELDRISDLEVVDESALVEEMELAFQRITEQDDSGRENATIVEDLCLLILPGTLQPSQLDKLLENPVRIKKAFGRLARARQGTAESDVAAEVAARVLHDIADAVGGAPLVEQKQLYRKAAELLSDVADPLRMKLVFEKMLPRVTSDSPERALIRSLNDEEIVQLLTTRVPLHDGALRAISSGFRNLDLSLPRRESILEAVREKATANGARSEVYMRLFDALSSAAELKSAPDGFVSALNEEAKVPMASARCLELTREEASQIEQAMKSAGVSHRIENIPAMINLLHLEEDAGRLLNLLDMLETLRKETLREGRLDFALKILRGYAAEGRSEERTSEERETCGRFLEQAVGQETITSLAEMALQYERSSPEYALILKYFQAVPEHAHRELLRRLEEEKARQLRLAIRGLLIALGSAAVASLSSRVLDERWFVARNAVSILGEIGGENAVEALARALAHEEPRVRREALNALGKIGGEGSARCLATGLDDGDSGVALCAARWLTMLGDVAPLEGLIRIVESPRFRQTDLEVTLTAVRAIARDDGAEARSFLRRIARRRIATLFGSGRRIAACASQALREEGV